MTAEEGATLRSSRAVCRAVRVAAGATTTRREPDAEIAKAQVNGGRRRELYYFRDQQGLEVDFIVPGSGGAMRMLEVKATRTPTPAMAAPMLRLAEARRKHTRTRGVIEMLVVHRPARVAVRSHALAPGVEALPWQEFVTARLVREVS